MSMVIYGWIPGGMATILMLYAIFMTIKSSNILAKDLKFAVNSLLISLISYWLMGISIGLLLVLEIPDFSLWWWFYLPMLALLGALFFVIGARKLLTTFEDVLNKK